MFKQLLNDSKIKLPVADGLSEFLALPEAQEHQIEYTYPRPEPLDLPRPSKRLYPLDIRSIRIPARINNPLIPYHDKVKKYILSSDEGDSKEIHSHHHSHLKILRESMEKLPLEGPMRDAPITFDINILKRMSNSIYSNRTELINLSALSFAKRATQHDLGITAMEEIPFTSINKRSSKSLSFLITIHRLRALLGRLDNTHCRDHSLNLCIQPEAELILYTDYTYSYSAKINEHKFCIIVAGGHFRIYHSDVHLWFCGTVNYLDYMFSTADINSNLDIIMNCNEYNWGHDFFDIIKELTSSSCMHNDAVEFMKTLEGFLLNLSDYDENYAMNWRPIMEAAYDLWTLDKKMNNLDYDFKIVPALIHDPTLYILPGSVLQKVIQTCRGLERTQIQELSSLHKMIFYAEVDSLAGVKKFLKRVHTPRAIDPNAIKNITRSAKKLFLVSYHKKHNMAPNLIGNAKKIKLLQVKSNRREYEHIMNMPLSWWDDITIFNCMDNKLTNDALEFAKDKGALKKEVHFGPGDSRKELLQVIEQEDYELKDFFKQGKFPPKTPRVYTTHQCRDPFPTNHPVRLIEKEREQKIEARLFANGELSDKHALSLVTTRMKKALSYFDEQLMTPADKHRKKIIHAAAQTMRQPDMYSLLLDIEGHNQSMQYTNTSELSEFCGNLFGEQGWGDLPNYFSHLDVFHYDEFIDDVILSQGQLGGIEGWLNPLWTLHTTLMMKLLRDMTDIEIRQIMVYSDDVNATIRIIQASEETVRAVFNKIIKHCLKFGMIVKFSQTNLSKHRITMLRQHYADGVRADSTLKKLISTSGANNPMVVSEEIEVSGICSSIASALELSNHNETCCYLKHYKIGILLARLPHIILSRERTDSCLSSEKLPKRIANLLYNVKDDMSFLVGEKLQESVSMIINDIGRYLHANRNDIDGPLLRNLLKASIGESQSTYKFVDSADRLLYLQVQDPFLQDLLFFWTYLPATLGGLGAIFHINLILSGHSSGFSKSIHYLHQWISKFATEKQFFFNYLEYALGLDIGKESNHNETRILSTSWPSDITVTTANTSISQSIESMVKFRTRNKNVKLLMKLKDDKPIIMKDLIELFRDNMHPRVCQFYAENTSCHFLDLLINKIETSSGLLSFIKNLPRLRNSMQNRMMENILLASRTNRATYGIINVNSDTVDYLMTRRRSMFPKIKFIEVDEILYDNRFSIVVGYPHLITIRKCTPMHYENGIKVYDMPHVGNEASYKGEFLDDDRMISNKEEYLAAKLVAVTKWFLSKAGVFGDSSEMIQQYDCVKACNLSLSTLTGQGFDDLQKYSPNETGGEILHRIPNLRFTTMTYIRAEMNRSLTYTAEINQREANDLNLVDSNLNFDYVRLRFLLAAVIKDKYPGKRSFITRYNLKILTGIQDVQFVTPKLVTFTPNLIYINYGKMRGHLFSELKFRYMVNSYLNVDEIRDISLIPTLEESQSSKYIEVDIIDDMVYHYAKALDREHMSVLPVHIDLRLWMPLTEKLMNIIPRYKELKESEWLQILGNHLSSSLSKRRLITTISKSDKVQLTLQNQCIESVKLYYPNDEEFNLLASRYQKILQREHMHKTLNEKTKKYQKYLKEFEQHRDKLGLALICEYIITLNFHAEVSEGSLRFDARKSVELSLNMEMFSLSMLLLVPDIKIKSSILGIEFLERIMISKHIEIMAILAEISEDNLMVDVIAPGSLPNLKPHTILDGDEYIPESAKETEYEMEEIPEKAMERFEELKPLAGFASKCVIHGAHPAVFTSPTGSDSFAAQHGLFKMLKSELGLTNSTKICDLTAGRGDFQYVCRELKLTAESYSTRDAFTQIYHHPKVQFGLEYDITKTSTLKFLLDYQFVHIDISFVGSGEVNVLDLILFLESNNIGYSLRINSVDLIGYIRSTLDDIPTYIHHLAFPVNRIMKTYQLYLVGVPGISDIAYDAISMKKTVAFRSIALSYARLLSPANRELRLYDIESNSLSIYLGNLEQSEDIILKIANRSYEKERLYYSSRYIEELSDGEELFWCDGKLNRYDSIILKDYHVTCQDIKRAVYLDYSENDIGSVSSKSLPYHIAHLSALQDKCESKKMIKFDEADNVLLEYMRIHHPVSEVRTKCNVILGVKKFNYTDFLSGRLAVKASIRESKWEIGPRDTLHQIEVQNSLKLMMLSASHDNYKYGVDYLSRMLLSNTMLRQSYMRTMKCYRLLSTHYDLIHSLVFRGMITIKEIEAIKHELEVREVRKLKHKVIRTLTIGDFMDDEIERDIVDESLVQLFDNLLGWAEDHLDNPEATFTNGEPNKVIIPDELSFDIDIDMQVERTLLRLGLSEPNQYGYIDIGDNLPPEDEGGW